ncbi:sporulation protein YunB [Paenibacillus albiflavus]|uniref:Sporulation protein YunB n=1 Tax=Paenibacillus albiflavus TaxID=2545760 RepID=A0A4R4E8K3_9BACL|nr:sporulation protein YunB [Paenibacillus albiflavus]TCZ75879.1 sporulation protein YunB [Paenibacillus albiflavus]
MLQRRPRWKSRRTTVRKMSKKRKWFIILLIFVLFIIQSFIFIDHNLKKPMMFLAKVRLKQIATESINTAITQQISESSNTYKLLDWKLNKDGKVTSFVLNYAEHMRITSGMISSIQNTLKTLESIPEHIPLGQALGSPLIGSFGPNIPIRLVPQGAAKVEINTRPRDIGINNILFEVYAHVTVDVRVIIPFDSAPEVVETDIPISYALVVGDVPAYYFDNKGNPVGGTNNGLTAPNISLPDLNLPKGDNSAGAGGANTKEEQQPAESDDSH